MFTDPKIVTTPDIKVRSYITYYYEGKRFREYNANKLNGEINPNYTTSLQDRNRLLNKLQYEFKKALEMGWSPLATNTEKNKILADAMQEVLEDKLESTYSKTYKRDLSKLHEQFTSFLPKSILHQYVSNLELKFIELFLNQFKSSNRHYMNKRRTLSVFFSEMVRKGYTGKNLVLTTPTQKPKSVLHDIYSPDDLKAVLQFLEHNYPNLYLCCLITYGCLLRPHQEIRLLNRGNINSDFTKIQLSGEENKSGRIRTVHIPDYLKIKLEKQLFGIEDRGANIFTLESGTAFNEDYFKTQWSRAKNQMTKKGIISKNQTIYSFRHTAAVNVYRKSKDLHLLQQLLQHSNMIVTLNYLRGLGEVNDERLKEFLPEL
jgi:site-specific recombinase XerD